MLGQKSCRSGVKDAVQEHPGNLIVFTPICPVATFWLLLGNAVREGGEFQSKLSSPEHTRLRRDRCISPPSSQTCGLIACMHSTTAVLADSPSQQSPCKLLPCHKKPATPLNASSSAPGLQASAAAQCFHSRNKSQRLISRGCALCPAWGTSLSTHYVPGLCRRGGLQDPSHSTQCNRMGRGKQAYFCITPEPSLVTLVQASTTSRARAGVLLLLITVKPSCQVAWQTGCEDPTLCSRIKNTWI